jgi:hypothetical protein
VFRTIGCGVKVVTKIMVVRARANIFPAMAFIDTQGIATIEWILTELFPHRVPFAVVVINKFKARLCHGLT